VLGFDLLGPPAQLDSRPAFAQILGLDANASNDAVRSVLTDRILTLLDRPSVKAERDRAVLAVHAVLTDGLDVATPPIIIRGSQVSLDLAPIIQGGFPFDEAVVETVRGYCAPLKAAGVDTVILGSTHYPLCAPILQRMLGPRVTLVSAGAGVARSVERALAAKGLLREAQQEGQYRFQCTADAASFKALGTRFLQMPLGEVVHVELEQKLAA